MDSVTWSPNVSVRNPTNRFQRIPLAPFYKGLEGAEHDKYLNLIMYTTRNSLIRFVSNYNQIDPNSKTGLWHLCLTIDSKVQKAYIQNISSFPGHFSGSALVRVAIAICESYGVVRVDLTDATNVECADDIYSYSHQLLYRKGLSYYEQFGFVPNNSVTHKRSMQRLGALTVEQALKAWKKLVPDTGTIFGPESNFGKFLPQLEATTTISYVSFIASMDCKNFLNYEDLLQSFSPRLKRDRTLGVLTRVLKDSRGPRKLLLPDAMVGGNSKMQDTTFSFNYTKYKLVVDRKYKTVKKDFKEIFSYYVSKGSIFVYPEEPFFQHLELIRFVARKEKATNIQMPNYYIYLSWYWNLDSSYKIDSGSLQSYQMLPTTSSTSEARGFLEEAKNLILAYDYIPTLLKMLELVEDNPNVQFGRILFEADGDLYKATKKSNVLVQEIRSTLDTLQAYKRLGYIPKEDLYERCVTALFRSLPSCYWVQGTNQFVIFDRKIRILYEQIIANVMSWSIQV
jgi:hypothetical protein